ncbi:porin family protein [Hymenobacter sp. GOD-10R]|uniref:porin family protein n=1 Tax=Hymenobacter sp. GOD-10R TaxID=3093922 RepID=UPI002D775FC1|nr:porin family protein [Hymenobacter sp. GOD-10R]WRQ28150.1 porin family protein [Hymenobacter sp. GOD-10R]
MNKFLLVTTAVFGAAVFVIPTAYAQGIGIGIGVKAGGNASRLAGGIANKDYYSTKYGGHGGLLLNVSFLKDGMLSVQPEVLFSQRGYKIDNPTYQMGNSTFNLKGTSSYNYLDVPVLIKFKLKSFYVEAGPQYSRLLNVKDEERYLLNGKQASHSNTEPSLARVNRNEIGLATGLGVQTNSGLLIGLRYNASFTEFAQRFYHNNELANARFSVFQASVGYLLKLK